MLFFSFDHPHKLSEESRRRLLGGKGAGLALMAGELGLPVPPGFTLTTEAFDCYRSEGWNAELDEALRSGVAGIEAVAGRHFGGAEAPLLLSVRSGAPVSMPGMMDSVLNVGHNAATVESLGDSDTAFALDCQDRLVKSFVDCVGKPIVDDPWQQLRLAVEGVFRSADSDRARSYREQEGLPPDPVTAVNVQAMVFGNRDDRSATGVVFSRDPSTGEPGLYGDILFRAQGEDVVSGRQATQPVAALFERLPQAAQKVAEMTAQLERQLRDLCEVEFTIEQGELFLLQVRQGKRTSRAALRIAADLALEPESPERGHLSPPGLSCQNA